MSNSRFALLLLSSVVVLAGCQQEVTFPLDYGDLLNIVYSQHIQPLFHQKCATSGCHTATSAAAGLVLDGWKGVMRGSERGVVMIPFRSKKSHLVFHINRDSLRAPVAYPPMPPDKPLRDAEIKLVMRWIDEGARNDAEEIWKFRVCDESFVGRLVLGARRSPAQIVLSPDGRTGYVSTSDLTGTHRGIQVFDTQTMEVVGEVTDQRIRATHGVQLTRDGKFLWTTNEQSDNIAIIDVATRAVVEIVKVDPSVPDLPLGPPRFGPS